MSKVLGLLLSFTVITSNAVADESAAKASLDSAKTFFAQRVAFAKDEPAIENANKALEEALTQGAAGDLRYEVLNLHARVLNWKGLHTSAKAKDLIYEDAMKKADAARKMPGYETKADGHYWYAVALGRWALEKGPLTVLGRTGEMKSALDDAMNGETLAGEPGDTIDHYGPQRVYGRLYMELPPLAGGSNKKARQSLEVAYTSAPEYSLNAVYYAQSLDAVDETPKACEVIADLLKKDPLTMIPERAQEAIEDFADAKKFQTENCSL